MRHLVKAPISQHPTRDVSIVPLLSLLCNSKKNECHLQILYGVTKLPLAVLTLPQQNF